MNRFVVALTLLTWAAPTKNWAQDLPKEEFHSQLLTSTRRPENGYSTAVESVFSIRGPDGQTTTLTNRSVELASGLNFRNSLGELEPSSSELQLEPGQAVGLRTDHKVWLPSESGEPIRLQLPTGELLESRVYGLGYYDPVTHQSVLIASAKAGVVGDFHPPNRVVYPSAFEGLDGEIQLRHGIGSFQQDIVLRQAPPPPEAFGLSGDSVRLEVWTEFISAPEPVIESRVLNEESVADRAEPPLRDDTVDFGPCA